MGTMDNENRLEHEMIFSVTKCSGFEKREFMVWGAPSSARTSSLDHRV